MIGIDVASVIRFKKIKPEDYFAWNKFYTPQEWQYCLDKADYFQHLGSIFAAKEAVIKASGGKVDNFSQIEIFHGVGGQPRAVVHNSLTNGQFHLSISHDGEYVVAVALFVENRTDEIAKK